MEIWPALVAALFGEPDERFVMHRYRSSRFALAIGLLLMFGWIAYDLLLNHQVRQDLLLIGATMGVAKLGAMAYYHIAH